MTPGEISNSPRLKKCDWSWVMEGNYLCHSLSISLVELVDSKDPDETSSRVPLLSAERQPSPKVSAPYHLVKNIGASRSINHENVWPFNAKI
jgi:hypothetical protein